MVAIPKHSVSSKVLIFYLDSPLLVQFTLNVRYDVQEHNTGQTKWVLDTDNGSCSNLLQHSIGGKASRVENTLLGHQHCLRLCCCLTRAD